MGRLPLVRLTRDCSASYRVSRYTGSMIDTTDTAAAAGRVPTGSSNESTSAMLRDLLMPASAVEQAIGAVAQRWKRLKVSLHADVPAAFAPRTRCDAHCLDPRVAPTGSSLAHCARSY